MSGAVGENTGIQLAVYSQEIMIIICILNTSIKINLVVSEFDFRDHVQQDFFEFDQVSVP